MNKEKSKLIKQIKEDVENKLRKMHNGRQEMYNYVNRGLNDLKELIPEEDASLSTNYASFNLHLRNVLHSIDDLDDYYQKQLKPFLDEENDN